ncbi:MAG TPA: PAS domain S-box protein [Planctomycetes bacterium]|nr:PAS domain S-box protein [Planctomycetota bacterium]
MEEVIKMQPPEPARAPLPAAAESCTEILGQLARIADTLLPDHSISILLVGTLRPRPRIVAAPSLPVSYTRALETRWRLAKGWHLETPPPELAPFDRIFTGRSVGSSDLGTDPLPAIPAEEAREAGVRSLWCEPIHGPSHEVAGALLFHGTQPAPPDPRDLELFTVLAKLASTTLARQLIDAAADTGEEGFRRNADPISVAYRVHSFQDGELIAISPSFESLFGLSDHEFRSDPHARNELIHPEDRPRMESALASMLRSAWLDEEFRILRSDGTTRLIRERAYPVHDIERRLDLALVISEDVTAEREAALRVRESEASFREMAENLGATFWLTDWLERRVIYVSPGWEKIWGQPVDCLYSDDLDEWSYSIHPDDRERVLSNFRRLAERGEYEEDFRVVHPDGSERWLHERAFPIRDEHGAVYRMAGIAEDITERKRFELELARARDEIEALRRREVLSLTSELLFAEENERRRLAQGLHDGMNQIITLALLKLAQLGDRCEGEERRLTEEIETLLEEAGQETRALTYELSPPILHDLGFEPALEWLAEDIEKRSGMTVDLNLSPLPAPLGPRLLVLLFRAVRELFRYLADVSESPGVRVTLTHDSNTLRLDLEAGGAPLSMDQERRGGLSLSAIGQRLEHLGGRMIVRPAPTVGTLIAIEAPLSPPSPSSP